MFEFMYHNLIIIYSIPQSLLPFLVVSTFWFRLQSQLLSKESIGSQNTVEQCHVNKEKEDISHGHSVVIEWMEMGTVSNGIVNHIGLHKETENDETEKWVS